MTDQAGLIQTLSVITGGLGPVLDLYFWQRSRSLSWTPPFQLNTSERIVYSITVVKVTEGLHGFEEFPNHTDTFLKLDGKVEVGHHYNASVVPVNAVGRGEATSLSFHMEERDLRGGYVLTVRGMEFHILPPCQSWVSTQVSFPKKC